jgi:hypothetical protein
MQAVMWSPDLKQAIRSGMKQGSKKETDSFISAVIHSKDTGFAPQKQGQNGQEPGRPRPATWD